jgi:hypothetical protein
MGNAEITEIQRIFSTRLEALGSILVKAAALLQAIECDDSRRDEIKHTTLGPGLSTETSARLFVSDFWIPNFYFHITTTYSILQMLGVPLGKTDFMAFLMPYVRQES